MYEWDPAKAKSNQEEHGVDFADAVQVFDNPYLNQEDTDAMGDQVLWRLAWITWEGFWSWFILIAKTK